eukprot:scaffold179487_cov21-Tisochrysis_lutea.AAC.1
MPGGRPCKPCPSSTKQTACHPPHAFRTTCIPYTADCVPFLKSDLCHLHTMHMVALTPACRCMWPPVCQAHCKLHAILETRTMPPAHHTHSGLRAILEAQIMPPAYYAHGGTDTCPPCIQHIWKD